MRTKEEILENMIEEMPYQLIGKDQVLPYIKEAMDIYARELVKESDSLPGVGDRRELLFELLKFSMPTNYTNEAMKNIVAQFIDSKNGG